MGDKIHPTHFTVPEIPYKMKEREAILLLQKIVMKYNRVLLSNQQDGDYYSVEELGIDTIAILDGCSDELHGWVMKYKGK
jgi:hypothetical protein